MTGAGFGRERRIRKKTEFDAVFAARHRAFTPELLVYVSPSPTSLTRLGISMSRRVGTAARRNRIKRMIREAFRLSQDEWPAGLDIVVVPRPHEPMPLETYRLRLGELVVRAEKKLP